MAAPARDHAGVFIPPPLFYVVPLAAGYLIDRTRPAPIVPGTAGGGVHTAALAAGWVLVASGAVLMGSAFWRFVRARTAIVPILPSTTIVAEGPYRYTRNPMYLGLAVAYVGAALLVDSLWPLLLLPLAVAGVQGYVIRREERYLEAKFGDEYRAYKARVRRWM